MNFKDINNSPFKICGIGNATVDIQYKVTPDFLEAYGFRAGVATYITLEQALEIEANHTPECIIPGGAAANSLCGLATLGAECHFIGRPADDSMGRLFMDGFTPYGVTCEQQLKKDALGTGRCLTFTLENGERSFSPYFGANDNLLITSEHEETLKTCDYILVEGYPLQGKNGPQTLRQLAECIADMPAQFVFNPCDAGLIETHRECARKIMDHTDILICNEEEALTLSEQTTIDDASTHLANTIPLGAITIGDQGCIAFHNKERIHVPVTPSSNLIDTNGAGDQFIAGFLYAIGTGQSLEQAALSGHQQASKIITHFGPRPKT